MKPVLLLGLIALAIAVAVILHARKSQDLREPSDDIAFALRGIEQQLAPGQALHLRLDGVKSELFLHVRLALAPRHITLLQGNASADTLLVLKPIDSPDSLSPTTRVLWSAADPNYRYKLLTNR